MKKEPQKNAPLICIHYVKQCKLKKKQIDLYMRGLDLGKVLLTTKANL